MVAQWNLRYLMQTRTHINRFSHLTTGSHENRSINQRQTCMMVWNYKLWPCCQVCIDSLERCIFEPLNSNPLIWFGWDNKWHHLSGHRLESDWLASVLKVDWELLYSKSSLWWPFVGHWLICKWDSILMCSTDYWFTVHVCSCCCRCYSATVVLPAAQ